VALIAIEAAIPAFLKSDLEDPVGFVEGLFVIVFFFLRGFLGFIQE